MICRLAFVLCAIVPTLFAVRLVLSPSSTSQIETALRAATGIVATIDAFQTPRPGYYTLQSVHLPTSGGQELLLGTVLVSAGSACQIDIPETIRIDCTDLTGLIQQFCSAALPTTRAGLKSSTPAILRCQRVIVSDREFPEDPARQLILSPMEIHFATDTDRSVAAIRFQVAGNPVTEPVEIIVEQAVNLPAGGQRIRVSTGESNLPVWLAKAVWPDAESLLPNGLFSGQIEMAADAAGRMDGTVLGTVSQADLRQLFAGTSLDMTGTAQLVDVRCSVESGRIRAFKTILSAQSGSIGLASAQTMNNIGWDVSSPMQGEHWVRFRHFQVECCFENGRVELWPRTGNKNVLAWTEDYREVVVTRYMQTVAPIESLARRLFQGPGTGPASVESLGDRAVGFLSRFNLAPGSIDAVSGQSRMAENDRPSTNRF